MAQNSMKGIKSKEDIQRDLDKYDADTPQIKADARSIMESMRGDQSVGPLLESYGKMSKSKKGGKKKTRRMKKRKVKKSRKSRKSRKSKKSKKTRKSRKSRKSRK